MAAAPNITASPRNGNGQHARTILDWILKFAGAIALAAFGFLFSLLLRYDGRMDAHEIEIASFKANRFTAQDGTVVERRMGTFVTREELAVEIRGLRDDIREIRTLVSNGN